MKQLLFSLLFLFSVLPAKADILKDLDSLGGNDVLFDKAQALRPESRVEVVQDRVVPRRNRFEFAPEYSTVLGGDPYNRTQNIGLNVHYHLNPRFSLGIKYGYSYNKLRPEGEALINDRAVSETPLIPDIDYPKSQIMAFANVYPFYGKLSLFNMGVVHFDIYGVLGAGSMEVRSGRTGTYAAGGGLGLWLSQHLTARAELLYQTYQAQRYTGSVDMKTTVLGLQVGYLL